MKKYLALFFIMSGASANAQEVVTLCSYVTTSGVTYCQPVSSAAPLPITLGAIGVSTFSKQSAAPSTAAGAGFCKEFWVAGTNSGSGKLQAICGTSTTPVTIVDNVGAGF